MAPEASAAIPPVPSRFAAIASDALRYWEQRRFVYNIVLFGIVAVHFLSGWPDSASFLTWDRFFILIILAVLANVCYCAAYIADLFVQFAGLRSVWVRSRWVLLLVGIFFAAVITQFFALGVLSSVLHGPV